MLFDVFLLLSLGLVTLWFFWPNLVDTVALLRLPQKPDSTDRAAEALFRTWADQRRAVKPVFRSHRS
ncbi:MAG: hypothetical protein AAGF55_10200 [Pseudomonadota bacterium]